MRVNIKLFLVIIGVSFLRLWASNQNGLPLEEKELHQNPSTKPHMINGLAEACVSTIQSVGATMIGNNALKKDTVERACVHCASHGPRPNWGIMNCGLTQAKG